MFICRTNQTSGRWPGHESGSPDIWTWISYHLLQLLPCKTARSQANVKNVTFSQFGHEPSGPSLQNQPGGSVPTDAPLFYFINSFGAFRKTPPDGLFPVSKRNNNNVIWHLQGGNAFPLTANSSWLSRLPGLTKSINFCSPCLALDGEQNPLRNRTPSS